MRCGLICLLFLATGCANFEYDLVQPVDVARKIGSKTDEVFTRDAIEYRLVTMENRLILRAYNTTESPMTLNGEKSVTVDENGQSHPLRSLTIAPKSFVKLILPPLRPKLERVGPSFGIGFGGMYGDARRPRPYGYGAAMNDAPQYFAVYDDDAYYWNWTKESQVRLTLVYEQEQMTIRHEFVFGRRKV